jgi:hypothetical protein
MSKHTPGPWVFFDDHPEKVVYHIREKNHLYDIATIYRYESNPIDTLADARLIAAAPELLEALEALLVQVEQYGHKPECDAARAAIAKAKGEE